MTSSERFFSFSPLKNVLRPKGFCPLTNLLLEPLLRRQANSDSFSSSLLKYNLLGLKCSRCSEQISLNQLQ